MALGCEGANRLGKNLHQRSVSGAPEPL